MAEAELDTRKLLVPELLAIAAGVASAMEGNPHFPAPNPTPQELTQLAAELTEADRIYREERLRATKAQAVRDSIAEKLRKALAEEVQYVQEASEGDLTKILSANLHVEEETQLWPFGAAGDVDELSASAGDAPGEIDLAWDPVPGASGYEVEIAHDLIGEESWEQCGASTMSKMTIQNLSNQVRCWFRVRAVNERGAGDWSAPVMKFAR
jgi:hypothetical protein